MFQKNFSNFIKLSIFTSIFIGGCISTNPIVGTTPILTPNETREINTSGTLVPIDSPQLTGIVVYHRSIGKQHQIFTVSLVTGEKSQLTKLGDNIEPVWSPDGMKIVYACDNEQDFEICIMDSDGRNNHQLTDNDFDDWGPYWSPDGKRIVFVSNEVPYAHLNILDIGTGETRRLLNATGNEGSPKWSPNGNQILFMSDRDGFNLYTVWADGTGEEQITSFAQDDRPAWSFDGTRITFRRQTVFSSLFSGAEIFVADADGKNAIQLTNNTFSDDWPTFSPDEQWILYSSSFDLEDKMLVIPVTGGDPVNLIQGGISGTAPDWKP